MTKLFDSKKHVSVRLMPTPFPAVSQHSPEGGSFSTFISSILHLCDNSWQNFRTLEKPNFNENIYVNFKIRHNCV